MNRRQFLLTGTAGLGLLTAPAVSARPTPGPPGVRHRHTYENLWVTGTARAHRDGRVLVGRAGSRPDPDDPVRIAVVGDSGDVQRRASLTPDLPDDAHATPDVVRTGDGYAVAAGPWLARFDTDLSVQSIGKHTDIAATRHTSLVPVSDGFVAGFTVWLPNAFWTHFVGFDAGGNYRWHHEHNVNGSQALGFLVPDGDGGAIAGGTFPWLAELDADGTFREVELPGNFPAGVLNAGVRDGEGLVLCSGNGMVRLDASYERDWARDYDSLADEQVVEMTAAADGGFLFLTGGVSVADALLCKTDASGELRWTHGYSVDSGEDSRIQVLAEPSPGEYLVAGGYHLSTAGWALGLSSEVTPTPSPTASPTATRTVRDPITDTPATETPTDDPDTTTTGPGFGAVTGGLAIVGALVARALRTSDG